MSYGDIKDWICIFFNLEFLLFQTKNFITSCLKRWKEKHKNIEVISRFKYNKKFSPLKRFNGYFLIHIKTGAQIRRARHVI